jgi:alkylation response protein AidB-like acyl-CoA dehydrogenase
MTTIQTQDAIDIAKNLAQEIATRADEADRLGKLPPQDIAALRASGFLTLSIPVEYGGQGLSMADCLRAQMELAKGSTSTALVAAMQMQIFGNAREKRPWSEEHFTEFCRAAVEDGALFNSIASEPLLGSPSRGKIFQTTLTAASDSDGWRLNGHKTWSTGGVHLTHMLVRASLDEGPGVVLVLQGTPGVEWKETWGDTLGLRASDSHDVHFDDVRISEEQIVEIENGKPGGTPNAWFPMVLAATYLGTALAARDTVIRYALERVPTALGKPIATLPKIQRQIGEMDMPLQAARCLLLSAAEIWEEAPEERGSNYYHIAAAKQFAVETATRVTEQALEVAGGISLTRTLPLERYFRDVRAGMMQPPSGDTAYEIIGRSAITRQEADFKG